MPSFRMRLLFVAVLLVPVAAYAADTSHDPRPLTYEEDQTFYPLVCDGLSDLSSDVSTSFARSCGTFIGDPHARPITGDGPIEISYKTIAYGSFSNAGTDEAYVTYSSNMEGEGSFSGGGILFERKNGKWQLVRLTHGGQMDRCLALPGNGQQKMLCLDMQHSCCGLSYESIKIMTATNEEQFHNWNDKNYLLAAHNGGRGFEDDVTGGGKDFCAAGQAGRTLLTGIYSLKRSEEAGMFAEASIGYVTPGQIRKECREKKPWAAQLTETKVRFVLDGEKVKVLLPEGVGSFWTY